ncbi:glycoside hydrolase family 97 protein [Chitinophaga sp. Hz27]|uniref:glycoside hydrolase family 97 protein n=1 Tax=Chitinophaga sp. Hz27 TaxID=3347169 RepID=UPI0035E39E7D
MRKLTFGLAALLVWFTADAQSVETEHVKLTFALDKSGQPIYTVAYKGKPVVLPSQMGFVLNDDSTFYRNFRLLDSSVKEVDETWQPVWGEEKNIRNHYRQLIVKLQENEKPFRLLNIEFRVFADGVGFRYDFPKQNNLQYFVVADERTSFRMAGNHKTFWIPGDYDTNEYPYTTSKISEIDNRKMVTSSTAIAVRVAPDFTAVQTPLMMKTTDGLYINIHEAALLNYPAMQLHTATDTYTFSANLVPDAVGNKAYLHAPFKTPWRTIIVSDKATDILSSRLIVNLNEPSKLDNTSWIKPMKFIGVWWEMQTGKSTWSYSDYADSTDANGLLIPNGRHGANTVNVKRYIDFAAKNGIDGVLVEGWNTGWEDWFGNWKEDVFDFVTPYPDFDLPGIAAYAKNKGVSMVMHNETSGAATNYERRMERAFALMNQYGYKSVKTGYVGKIIPRGEHHDGQWMVNHYERVAQMAARHQVTLDSHEPMRPTGLHRTYPNWMASESARGNEYNAFSSGNEPEHETILPFTRLMGGPMDYTPGIFKIRYFGPDSSKQVHTTLAKQLALYVTMYSPVQMAADYPENYEAHMDAFQFIRDVPLTWDESKVIEAEPGDYITIARRSASSWFIGAITDENAHNVDVSLDFLERGRKYSVTIYGDGKDADWKSNPESYKIEHITADIKTVLHLRLAKGGGAAVSLVPVN